MQNWDEKAYPHGSKVSSFSSTVASQFLQLPSCQSCRAAEMLTQWNKLNKGKRIRIHQHNHLQNIASETKRKLENTKHDGGSSSAAMKNFHEELFLSFTSLVNRSQRVGTELNKYLPTRVYQPGAQKRTRATKSDRLCRACPLHFCVLAATLLSHRCPSIMHTQAWPRLSQR